MGYIRPRPRARQTLRLYGGMPLSTKLAGIPLLFSHLRAALPTSLVITVLRRMNPG